MDETRAGMTLRTLKLEPNYWRMGATSTNIVECRAKDVCLNEGTERCRPSHNGTLCNECAKDYYGDPVQTCKACKDSTLDIVFTILVPLGVLACVCCVWLLFREAAKGVVLPENFDKVILSMKILNFGFFTVIPISCWLDTSINYYAETSWLLIPVVAPFEELRDSVVAILAGAMMILTYSVAWLMKSRRTSLDDKYEADGLGVLMILCMGGILFVFIVWAMRTMRETKKQQDDLALDVLKKVERSSWSDGHGGSVGSVGVEVDGVEMGDLGGWGGRSSEFAVDNPMRGEGGGVEGGNA
ncbi:hypothetical protein TrRE_jg7012 [Triparma retinervis]|uniref:Uncharacterized protein n=1 Tax=Triparma retinervis TaxID=2557542 RepID=A0A9W7A7Z3_9STRA|nr:hypothetical protein TrRE_jg7012 [Triparma retinervis]